MPTPIEQIVQIAKGSDIAHFNFEDRGVPPAGYIKGMAVVYARMYCKLKAGDEAAVEMARAKSQNGNKDALAFYNQEFADAGMNNDADGVDALRHLFVLLTGLGMRESSGRFCEGRDRSADNVTADTAEAGLFQASFNARTASPLLTTLFEKYSTNPSGFVEIFREGVTCKPKDLENFGSGDGEKFQRLSKECPAFAVEFAAITLRNMRKHFGPINRKEAQVRRECDVMFRAVQQAVETFNLCSAFQ